jgi:hypothetical protein
MKTIRFSAFIAAAVFTIALTGCKKTTQDPEDWQSATDQASAESLHSDADDVVDNAANDLGAAFGNKGGKNTFDETLTICGAINVDSVTNGNGTTLINGKHFPRTVTIDFGTSTLCTSGTGVNVRTRELKGKTFITLSAPLRKAGSVATQTFDNFYIDGRKLEGTRTRTNNTPVGGAPTFTIAMANGKITDTDGKTFMWNASRTRTWTAGFGTDTRGDDEFDLTGSGSGTNRNGNAFSANITAPIHMTYTCRFPTRGTIVITRADHLPRTIDFGAGACDGTATVTVNGQTKTITLPNRR